MPIMENVIPIQLDVKNIKEEYRLVSQICIEVGCKTVPHYNQEGKIRGIYCVSHKLDGMIDVKHKNCIYPNCKTDSHFNFECESKTLYCFTHKLDGMTNIVSKTCIYPNCNTSPVYNVEGEIRGIYCMSHKLDGMVDIKNKMCIYSGCKTRPTYNFEKETKSLYCVSHKLDGMVSIISKTCIHPNCKIQPVYNLEGEAKALYCVSHKLDGMVNVNDKTCIHPNCKIRPNYNLEGEIIGIYCVSHKLDGMVDIKNKTCIHPNCKIQPAYNLKNETIGIYCGAHKLDGMVDVKSKKCKANYCLGTRANPKYKGYCSSCYQQLFPNDPLTLQSRSKTKEIAVRDFINLNFEGFHHDISLWTGNCDCTHRRRIDHRKLIGNTLLCIETDENQHKGYDKDKEEIRYDDLFMLHGGKFIFIRFNPDKFKNKEGKSSNPMLYTRLPILKDEIEKQIKRIENDENKKLLEIEKLYYDE
jgi:hypothetical protein